MASGEKNTVGAAGPVAEVSGQVGAPVAEVGGGVEAEPELLRQAAKILTLMSHPERLRVLCHLSQGGELSVGDLLGRTELSGSALSQHLAKLRKGGLVATRKERQMVYYRIGRADVGAILETLHGLYCRG